MLIGELSRRSGLSHDTLRYYVKLGLLEAGAPGTGNNAYRHYGEAAAQRIEQISLLKQCGFTLREIKGLLLPDAQRNVCDALPGQLDTKLAALDARMAQLATYRAVLQKTREACYSGCGAVAGLPECVEIGTRELANSKPGGCCG